MTSPAVTVVIPTHNRASLLPRTLKGALGQEAVDHEVVVVDDGSSDGTAEQLDALADPRLRVVRHDSARGVSRARNAGIEAARGEWVAFLDDDDLWAPDKLCKQLDAARAQGGEWVWTAAIALDEHLHPFRAMASPSAERIDERLLENCWVPAPSTVMVRTELVRRVGGFDPELAFAADWDLWIRLSREAPGASCPEVLMGYIEHSDNMLAGTEDPESVRPEFELLKRKHGDEARRRGVEFGNVWWTRWVASRHRLAGRRLAAARAYLDGARRNRKAGDVVRALGALGGERVWQPVRGIVVGRAAEPEWLHLYR